MSKQDKEALRFLNTKGFNDYNSKMLIIGRLKHDIPNLRLNKAKFVKAALRLYYNNELNEIENIRCFNRILKDICIGGHSDEYDYDLNGLSLDELNSKYGEVERTDNALDRKRSNNIVFIGDSDYTIVPIENFEHAKQYSDYTSWCITKEEYIFKSLTKGGRRFYFCYKQGFEDIPKNNDNAPLNDYGLSLISILVDMEGNLDDVSTRYNHEFNGCNNPLLQNTEQIEAIINKAFYKTFLPYTCDELRAQGFIFNHEVQELLDNGAEPDKIFDSCNEPNYGIRLVGLNGKYNWITEDGKLLLSNEWVIYGGDFCNDYAVLMRSNRKWNFIDTNGKLLSPNQWFDHCSSFSKDNTATIFISGKGSNWIDKDGKIVFPNKWYFDTYNFRNGYACVIDDIGWNVININGQYLLKYWHQEFIMSSESGNFVLIQTKKNSTGVLYKFFRLKDRKYITRKNLKYLGIIELIFCKKFYFFYVVSYKGKYNLIDDSGNFVISDNDWFDTCPKENGDKHIITSLNNNVIDITVNEEGKTIITKK